jgi:hypothetical protein
MTSYIEQDSYHCKELTVIQIEMWLNLITEDHVASCLLH